jgi:hypothetical protein
MPVSVCPISSGGNLGGKWECRGEPGPVALPERRVYDPGAVRAPQPDIYPSPIGGVRSNCWRRVPTAAPITDARWRVLSQARAD